MRSVPESSSVGGGAVMGRDPWAGFAAGPQAGPRYASPVVGDGRPGRPDAPDGTVADVARRLQGRVDGQDGVLDRVLDPARYPDDHDRMAQLRDAVRRMRRDSEVLLLLSGAEPGARPGPHTVPALLDDAVALVEEPSRVATRSVPAATLTAPAATELRHLVAELVDEAAAASPGARIEVGGRIEPDGALVVEVVVAGRGWTDALGPRRVGPGVADRLARRSALGIRLQRPLIDEVEGLVATVHCPAVLVTAERGGGDPWRRVGPQPPPDPFLLAASLPVRSRSGDELFGPLPAGAGPVGTPIFEAVASAWFRDDERVGADEWSSPGDREWRAAEARATRPDDAPQTTSSGLPRRSPGDRLVPPPRAARQPVTAPDERVPERVRDRLATYQRGLQQGRHRAADAPAEGAPDAWSADGW